jgi:prolyl-tRNA synthetase
MRWTKLFIPTLRENPADVEGVGRQSLVRAGYWRQLAPGVHANLFLAERSLEKIAQIVREEMDAIGAQELRLPVLHPAASVVSSIAQGELRSYRQLPQIWHHIQTRFDEQRHSRPNLLRARQFLVSESFSIDIDAAARDVSYQKHLDAYSKILDRCGLNYIVAETHAGAAFVIASEARESVVVHCRSCGYSSDLETARARASQPTVADPEGDFAPEPFHTPGRKTIADVADFTGLPATTQMKSLVLVAGGRPVLALVRGDHSLNEPKFAHAMQANAMQATEFRPAHADEIRQWFGADAGSLGPVGVKNMPGVNMRIVADEALRGRRNMIAGANKDDYHLRHVTPGEDFEPEYFELRQVKDGDECFRCGRPLEFVQCLELARAHKADGRDWDLQVQNEAREDVKVSIGSYNLYLERILSAAAELHHDPDGMALPAAVAPFDVVITPVSVTDAALRSASEEIYEGCRKMDLDVLLDDRDERPGVKFKDADLLGIPYRITIGKKLAEGIVEIVERRTKKREDVAKDYAAAFIAGALIEGRPRP